ncbi:hypothetical protein [Nonomuraea sp. JJY05]|uniref:hypothetical protein n=1 Tax=Nonomuraea sp. JJY05 TaxID=3350255 RepID=UPI00373EAF15
MNRRTCANTLGLGVVSPAGVSAFQSASATTRNAVVPEITPGTHTSFASLRHVC